MLSVYLVLTGIVGLVIVSIAAILDIPHGTKYPAWLCALLVLTFIGSVLCCVAGLLVFIWRL